jgi:hypothetical protein
MNTPRIRLRTALCFAVPIALGLVYLLATLYFQKFPLSGEYAQVNGAGRLEFSGHKVYVTTMLGTTFVSTYEIDGSHVVIKGAGGSQVFTRRGDSLDAGLGITYVKVDPGTHPAGSTTADSSPAQRAGARQAPEPSKEANAESREKSP